MLVAVLIGSIEVLGLISDQFGLRGNFWRLVGTLDDNFNALGFAIIGVFIVAWIVSVCVYRLRRLDELPAWITGSETRSDVAGLATQNHPACKREART